jgi:hypothetical protein
MQIGITSVQRNRNPYIVEWLAFHLNMGFTHFYIYAHKCTDGMPDTLRKLAKRYPITVRELTEEVTPQLDVYWDSIHQHVKHVDWMAFIDGDEFLFPVQHKNIAETLALFEQDNISSLVAYWMVYGSSGHLNEPAGLVTENFTRHAKRDFYKNKQFKNLLRGRDAQTVYAVSAYNFHTNNGTIDEQRRIVNSDIPFEHHASHNLLRINHYMTQSYDFYHDQKRLSGAADWNNEYIRDESWWEEHDRNEEDDGVRYAFLLKLKLKVAEMEAFLLAPDVEEAPTLIDSSPVSEPMPKPMPVPFPEPVFTPKKVSNFGLSSAYTVTTVKHN